MDRVTQVEARIKCYEDGTITAYNTKASTKIKGGNKNPVKVFSKNPKKIRCAVSRQYHNKQNKVCFITFTNPDDISYRDINICNKRFSKFLENLVKNYELRSYIWVLERNKLGVIHYHCFFEIPFFDINKMRQAYNKAMQHNSNNCLRFPPNKKNWFINNYHECATYVTKYCTKESSKEIKRVYGCSRNVSSKPIILNANDLEGVNDLIFTCRRNEYTSTFIVDRKVISTYLKRVEQIQKITLEKNESFISSWGCDRLG